MLKRSFDVVISIIALIVLLPVIIFVAYQIRKHLGKPVLFKQKRPGLYGKIFEMIKFRSMLDDNGNNLPDEKRLTNFGAKLRSTSLDELPELWNVLKGDMSIVGPRPLLVEYLPLYNKQQARRHKVRPGITGWAQINGRNSVSWEEKFNLDVWYVDNQSFYLDLKIFFITIKKVMIKDGIVADGHATTEKFRGEIS